MNNAILSCFSSYSYTNSGCNEVLTETPPISSNLFSDDNQLFFYEDFSNAHNHYDQQYTMDSILVSESSQLTSTSQLNYLPTQEDTFYQQWNTTFVQQTDNEIQLIQDARKRSAGAPVAATCSSLNSATNDRERERENKRPKRFQRKLPKIHKEKEATERRSQKLTDKITTLQKLVSPYGKTDTASVLLEASVSIQALQGQIKQLFHMLSEEQTTNMTGERRSDLESRGLCLVPSVVLEETDRRLPQHAISSSQALPAVDLFAENL